MGIVKSISRGVAKAATVVKGIQKSVATTAVKTIASTGVKVLPKVKNIKIFGSAANTSKAVSVASSASKLIGPVSLVATAAQIGVPAQKKIITNFINAHKTPQQKRTLGVTNQDVNQLATVAKTGGSMGLLGKAGKIGAGVAAGAGALYLGEQVAEKLGVRGGAGFIGARPMGARTHRRRGIISKRAMKNIRRVNSYKKQVRKAARVLGIFKTKTVVRGGKK